MSFQTYNHIQFFYIYKSYVFSIEGFKSRPHTKIKQPHVY